MKCLKIDDKWLRLILEGQKTWEIRRQPTNFRGRIALGNTKTKNYEGYATIIDCKKYTVENLKKFGNNQWANDFIEEYADSGENLFAYMLLDISLEPNPKPYSYSTGFWCHT